MRIRELVTIGVPLDLGAGGRRGVDMGPSAIRYAGLGERVGGLVGHHEDRGDIPAPLRETATPGDAHARYLEPIAATCAELSTVVESVASADGFPLVLGGDHSVAMGTLGGLAAARGAGGVIWLDAHADVNRPETTPSGNVHGMPLAAVLGRAGERFEAAVGATRLVDPERVALIGTRDVDPGE
ncbi:MAG: arginase family protein, partial [Gaiellales bacterium]